MASLIDMVLEYKLGGRTNQVADALRQSWRHLSVRQWQPPTGLQTYRIVFEMGLKKDPREAFCTKLRNAKLGLDQGRALGQNLSFFGMPLREQGVPRTSGAKTKQGEIL